MNLDYCFLDGRKRKRCYVHEAELRGCCRKITGILKWIIPGESRAFLIYLDKEHSNRGFLFGYFVIRRFEHITTPEIDPFINDEGPPIWTTPLYRDIVEDAVKKRKRLKIDISKTTDLERLSAAVERQFKGNDFLPSLRKGDGGPRHPTDDPMGDILDDLLKKYIRKHVENQKWFKDSRGKKKDREHAFLSWTKSQYEMERSCSKRLKVGATYIVDALAAEISDAFIDVIKTKNPSTIAEGEDIFAKIAETVRKNHNSTLTKVAPCLVNHGKLHGELVVLDEPYPIFQPKDNGNAYFRIPVRVDGDLLMNEICKCYEKKEECILDIPYC